MANMQNDFYTTKDLGETATLISLGCTMKGMQRKDGICYFVFLDRPRCEQLQKDYFFGSCPVNARTFYENLRLVKRTIYKEEGGERGKRTR